MAVEPRLLNPTTAKIRQSLPAQTQFDHRRRTPINLVAKDVEFSIQCQVKWVFSIPDSTPTVTNVGTDQQENGYIICRTRDLTALNKEIKKDDRITELGGKPLDLYVTRLEFGSHYGGEFKLVKIYFSDRRGKEV